MSGTQPTMADVHPPGAQVFKLPSYCMPLPVDPPSSPPSERQYPCKLDKDGVWRYKPQDDDYKPKSPTKHAEPYPTPKRKSKARSFSFHGDDIDENSSVVEVGKWVLGIGGLGLYAIECSEIFEEHNINGSGLLEMTTEAMMKLHLKMWECEIILNGIENLKAKSKAKRSLDKAMDEV